MVLKQVLEDFSLISGLHINSSKSQIYLGDVKTEEKQAIIDGFHLTEGTFPLKYLGVPLRPTKWKAEDYGIIVDKIKQRLHTWSSRHLSFAGKAQLIHYVLLGLRNYWMSIFVLPHSVTKEVEKLCRGFLWGMNGNRSKIHVASWEKVCLPKAYGGLSFKNGRFWDYELKSDTSWYWRKLCHLREKFKRADILKAGAKDRFKTNWLCNTSLVQNQVNYHKAIWSSTIVPKHRFILWQVVNSHLLTRDKLVRFQIELSSTLCPMCEAELETHEHIFFSCVLSSRVLEMVFNWMGYRG
uniref:Reverse transcriptase zinc-binding domain-containing protein n=1 Tax=Cannabis sativa TaxID=3483 RepID=A0A803NJ41_CANSA